jgi:hypothetical protein
MQVSLGEKLIYVLTNNGVTHDGIDHELELELMAKHDDNDAADTAEGDDEAYPIAAEF